MTKSLNVYVGRAATFKKNNGASVIENMAREILRKQGVTTDLSTYRAPGGKPAFTHYDLEFNGSHSGELAVCVFDSAPVGIDIQKIDTKRDMAHYDKIAARFFHPEEIKKLAALKTADRRRAFFELWSQKEAVMKQTGKGFALPLNAFCVDGGAAYQDGRRLPIALVPCQVDADYVCYVAVLQKKNTSTPGDNAQVTAVKVSV